MLLVGNNGIIGKQIMLLPPMDLNVVLMLCLFCYFGKYMKKRFFGYLSPFIWGKFIETWSYCHYRNVADQSVIADLLIAVTYFIPCNMIVVHDKQIISALLYRNQDMVICLSVHTANLQTLLLVPRIDFRSRCILSLFYF